MLVSNGRVAQLNLGQTRQSSLHSQKRKKKGKMIMLQKKEERANVHLNQAMK